MQYLTNIYRNLPFFDELNLYLNEKGVEIKRTVEKAENKVIIVENCFERTTNSSYQNKINYSIDKSIEVFLFFIMKPLILSFLFFILFSNLLYEFYKIIQLNKTITQITFIICISYWIVILSVFVSLILIKLDLKQPSLKLINQFSYLPYVGLTLMLIMFFYYNFISIEKTNYLYSCLIHVGIFSFFTLGIYKYILTPLQMVIKHELKFYRNEKNPKFLIVEVNE